MCVCVCHNTVKHRLYIPVFCIFCDFAHFCMFSAKCPSEQCLPHFTLTWILCQFRWSPQELKIRILLYLCTLLRAVPICFQAVGSCAVRRSSLEGKWGGIHQLSHEAVGETAWLPQRHSGWWEPGQTHVLHCQLVGMCWCDHDLHSGLPVIVSEQNEAIRPVLLDVLLSHQCLETGLQLIDPVVAAYCCLCVITLSIQKVFHWNPDVMNLWRNVFSYDSIRVGSLHCDKIISLHTSIRC